MEKVRCEPPEIPVDYVGNPLTHGTIDDSWQIQNASKQHLKHRCQDEK
jgi:hypothetical protein